MSGIESRLNRPVDAGLMRNPHISLSGLVGYWKMNEGTGLTAFDSSGYGNNGALSAAPATPTWVDGKFGNALSFDGGDSVDCGNNASLQITGNLSISVWVKSTATGTVMIVSKDDTTNRCYGLYMASNGLMYFYIFRANTLYQAITSLSYNNNLWHHVLGVNDGTDLKIYVDNVLRATSAGSGGTIDNDVVNLYIGAAKNQLYFIGSIDEAMIFNRALSASEISAIYALRRYR